MGCMGLKREKTEKGMRKGYDFSTVIRVITKKSPRCWSLFQELFIYFI